MTHDRAMGNQQSVRGFPETSGRSLGVGGRPLLLLLLLPPARNTTVAGPRAAILEEEEGSGIRVDLELPRRVTS